MLVASLALLSCERPTASRGHEPTSCYDTTSALAATPLKIEEPVNGGIMPEADMLRIKYGAWLIVAGFVLLAVVLGLALWKFQTAADVTAVVGVVAGVIGTIIGTFLGVHVGSTGKEVAESGRAEAERVARIAMAHVPPADATAVTSELP
jgi:hypothetical protein